MVDSGNTFAEALYESTRLNDTPSRRNVSAAPNVVASRLSYVAPPAQFTANPVRPADAASRSSVSICPGSSCDHSRAGTSVSWLPANRLVGGQPSAGRDAGSGSGSAPYG